MGKATWEVNVKNIEGTKQIVRENRQTKGLLGKNEAVCIYFETQEEN